jgi:SAM-dependent methyltransferase
MKDLLAARNALEAQSLAAFAELARGAGRLDALVLGAFDGGMAARVAASEGATVALVDSDEPRLRAARSVAAERGASISIKKRSLGSLREAFDPGSFDLVLSHLALAREEDLRDALGAIGAVARTDCLFAFSLPHPCFAKSGGDYFADVRRDDDGVPDWMRGPLFHRPIGVVSEILRDAGFVLVGARDLPGDPARPLGTACLLFECGKEKW